MSKIKTKTAMLLHIVLSSGLVSAALTACVTFDDYSQNWVGHPITDITKVSGAPAQKITNPDGTSEYRYEIKNFLEKPCIYSWLVDPDGTITGYRHNSHCQAVT